MEFSVLVLKLFVAFVSLQIGIIEAKMDFKQFRAILEDQNAWTVESTFYGIK
jgi:hypothetical protein